MVLSSMEDDEDTLLLRSLLGFTHEEQKEEYRGYTYCHNCSVLDCVSGAKLFYWLLTDLVWLELCLSFAFFPDLFLLSDVSQKCLHPCKYIYMRALKV